MEWGLLVSFYILQQWIVLNNLICNKPIVCGITFCTKTVCTGILYVSHITVRQVDVFESCGFCSVDMAKIMVFFKNISVISWWLALLVPETGVPRENHRPAESHWQTLSHNIVSSTPCLSGIWTHNANGDRHDRIGSYKSNYHTITTTTRT